MYRKLFCGALLALVVAVLASALTAAMMNKKFKKLSQQIEKIASIAPNEGYNFQDLCSEGYTHFNEEILLQEGISNPENRTKELLSESIKKMNNIQNIKGYKDSIPQIIHYIYVSSKADPKQISEKNVNIMLENIQNLEREYPGWKVYFWTNLDAIVPDQLRKLKNLEVKNIRELQSRPLYSNVVEFIKAAEKDRVYYSGATDMLRYIIIYSYGGVYMDGDYSILQPKELVKYIRSYDFIGGVQSINPYPVGNNAFIAAALNHNILQAVIKLTERNLSVSENIPFYIKYPTSGLVQSLFRTGPTAFTVAMYKALDTKNDIYFPMRILYNSDFPELGKDQAITRNYEGIDYIEKPLGFDGLSGSWVTGESRRNFCYVNLQWLRK